MTVLMMQSQLAELCMLIDRDDPVHVKAELEFAAMVAKVVREAESAESIAKLRDDRSRLQEELTRARREGAQVMTDQQTDLMATRMMLGTAEAYDGLEQHADRRQTQDTRQAA